MAILARVSPRTDTEKLNSYRRMILELIFSERNHFCPACVMNGDCDLQSMGYRLGMDHVRYQYLFPKYEMDGSHPYIGMDPNRCILCTRCIRACDEIAAVHTLDLKERGWQAQIEVDLRGELGNSTCIACGACVQVCPTGALFEKFGAYRSKRVERTVARTVCNACSIGCGQEVALKDNQLIKIDGNYESPVNRGLLCVKGRFQALENTVSRLRQPLVNGQPASWDEAISTIAERLGAIRSERSGSAIAGVTSPACSNETLYAFKKFVTSVMDTPHLDTLYSGDLKVAAEATRQFTTEDPPPAIEATLEDVRQADCVMLVGATPGESHEILASWIRRGSMNRRMRLLVVNTRISDLDRLAEVYLRPIKGTDGILINGLMNQMIQDGWVEVRDPEVGQALSKYTPEFVEDWTAIRPNELQRVAQIYASAERPIIVYGRGITKPQDPAVLVSLMNLALLTGNVEPDKLRILGLRKGGNAQGVADLGVFSDFDLDSLDPAHIRALYILTGDMPVEVNEDLLERLQQLEFLAVQGCYPGPLAEIADVLLPATLWVERDGTMTNLEHWLQGFEPILDATPVMGGFQDDWDVLSAIAERMGRGLDLGSLDAIQREIAATVASYQEFTGCSDVRLRPAQDLTQKTPSIVDYGN